MQIQCQHCQEDIPYSEPAPRFCQFCGNKLTESPAWQDSSDYISERLVHDDDGRWKSDNRLPQSPSKANRTNLNAHTIPPKSSTDTPVVEAPSGAGQTVGPYKLIRWIGSGGMGVVWEAIEVATGRRVALKRLSASMISDKEYVARFLREAQLAAKISHPNVTFIFGAGQENGQPYIAMELMPGSTLADQIRDEGPMPVTQAVDCMLNVVDGLIAAHRRGLIHRDIKPSNCFLDSDGTVKIGDFGLSKSLSETDPNLTKSGTFMGTPSFSAPEQIRGAELDEATDVYAVSATLYTLLTGQPPFIGDAMSVTAQIISDPAPSARSLNAAVPKDLDQVINICLEKDRDRRYANLEQLRMALMPFASHGTSLANLGRRVAAFMFDYVMIQILMMVLTIAHGIYLVGFDTGSDSSDAVLKYMPQLMFESAIVSWLLLVLYFAICEGIIGKTLGKFMMGLSVVNAEGERPGFWPALIRAFAIPGCFGISLGFGIYQALYVPAPIDAPSQFIASIFNASVVLIPCLICLSTMRESNFMRGVHGFLSGTRVVRLETDEARLLQIPIAKANLVTIKKLQFGPYESNELLGEFEGRTVYLGHDLRLNRDVWIITSSEGSCPSADRINLSRSTRQRWLGGGNNDDGLRWDAFEAINGVPILSLVGTSHPINWEQYRMVMRDVAEELQAALVDGTLPESLALPQVWIDQNCHAKILDRCLVNVVVGNSRFQPKAETENEEQNCRGVALLQELGDLLRRTTLLPMSAQRFLKELDQKPQQPDTLDWAIQQLEFLAKKTARLNWDTRAGLMGVTLGFEFTIYNLLAIAFFLMSYFLFTGLEYTLRFYVGLAMSLIVPVGLGFWLRGGPVFRFMDIDVCKKNGKLASRYRCAFRSLLAWIPTLVPIGGFVLISIVASEKLKHIEPIQGTVTYDWINHPVFQTSIISTIAFSVFLVIIGLIYSLYSPQRGLQDYAAGTRIMPH